ncbi:MAG: hypothetical protein JXA89_21825 [Anaerolineae bacterium]|nr:hypothetical protein [Anaerolineae bacterium]
MYLEEIQVAAGNPEALETLYRSACRAKEEAQFRDTILACYERSPDNVLYAAWTYRLQDSDQERGRAVNWKLAAPLSVVLGVIFWVLSGDRFELPDHTPYLAMAWAPIATCFVIAFLTITSGRHTRRAVALGMCLVVALLYVTFFVALRRREHYPLLMILHLPLLAWIGCGIYVLGWSSASRDRFAFVIKSIEVFISGGLYVGAGGAFAGITIGMFEALGISLPDVVMRLLFAGGFGLIPVLAIASVYDPRITPIAQTFRQGLSKIISTLMRLMLPLTLLVLVVYLGVIPFNFMEPFRNRDVLIVYNVMLFAVMGLLIGATPVKETDLEQRHHRILRAGIVVVAILAVVVSLYALSATVYRTVLGGFTVNRLAVVGWNSINISLLVLLVYRQFQCEAELWIRSLQAVYAWGMTAYAVWAVFLLLAIPLLF